MTTGVHWQPAATAPEGIVAPSVIERADEAARTTLGERDFPRVGRTAWLPLGDGSLKLKGIGHWDGRSASVNRPSSQVFTRPRGHVGISESGRLRLVDSAPAPLGGITVDRAMREFNTTLGMSRLDPLVVRPVRVYRLVDPPLRFPAGDGESFALVATLVPTAWPQRADTLFRAPERLTAEDREYLDRVRRGRSLIDTMSELAAGYGAALRTFTEAGFFRHSGSVDNWGIAPETGQVFLTDLDSTQTLTTVSETRRPVEVVRDVSSGVFGLAAALMLPGVTDDPAAAIAAFRRLVASYFAEVPADRIDESIAPLARYWTPLAERSWAGQGALTLGGDRAIWMDRDLCYCLLLHGLSVAYAAGKTAASWGEVDVDGLTDAIREFLGPGRFRRFEQFSAA